jgi:hypothetical protein
MNGFGAFKVQGSKFNDPEVSAKATDRLNNPG